MNNNKFIGPYSIPVPLLKILKSHISPLISSLINDSFLCGIFPSKLKLAKVTPVFKKGSRQDKDNYRPISVLSIFSKIFEKAMFKRLYGYLESCNILYPLQFGFRQKCSTNHALIQITESIRNSIDNNEFSCGIFIDLKKAFDTVNYSILLSKLNHCGVRGKAYYCFNRICPIENNLYVKMAINLILSQSRVEYLRDPFLDPCCFCYILMIYRKPRKCLVFNYLLMTIIYIVHVKS